VSTDAADTGSDELSELYRMTDAALPDGWRLDGLRCQSTGLEPDQRSDAWRAVAVGPGKEAIIAEGSRPADAIAALVRQVTHRRRC
jgi:hypothetical protein